MKFNLVILVIPLFVAFTTITTIQTADDKWLQGQKEFTTENCKNKTKKSKITCDNSPDIFFDDKSQKLSKEDCKKLIKKVDADKFKKMITGE